MGLCSEFIGYNASGGAARLCYRVILHVPFNGFLKIFTFYGF